MIRPILHPDSERWLEYVAGNLDPALALLLEAHLAFCEACAGEVARLNAPGGLLLARPAEGEAPPDLLERILAAVDRIPEPRPLVVEGRSVPLPSVLLRQLPPSEGLRWQATLGLGSRLLALSPGGAGQAGLFVLHLEAGRSFPAHDHRGAECSLILAGGLQDAYGTMEAGDYREYPRGSAHAPVALPDEDCWLLAVQEGKGARFKGWRGHIQDWATRS